MKHRLFDTPEILDIIMEYLLPPLGPVGCCAHSSIKVPKPTDLSRLMRVCRLFYGLALPWVWRRADIYLSNNFPPTSPWSYIRTHPEVGAHIHLLVLNLHFGFGKETHDLTEFRPIIYFLQNLQVLQFVALPNIELVDEVFLELIHKPRLHTLLISYYDPIHPRHIPDLRGLKRLYIMTIFDWHLPLLQAATCLESLAIHGLICDIINLPIPWETLCEIAIHGKSDWFDILENFSSWKEHNPTVISPLTAVSFEDCEMRHLERLFMVFEGQNLSRLSLSMSERVELPDLINRIVKTFPQLTNLHLFTDGSWPGVDNPEIFAAYSGLPLLKTLKMDYDFELPSWDISRFREMSQYMLPIIGQQCQVLDCVEFFQGYTSTVMEYKIQRNETGEYEGWREENVSGKRGRLTVEWDHVIQNQL